MGKQRRRKKSQGKRGQRPRDRASLSFRYVKAPSPLSHLSETDRIQVIKGMAQSSKTTFADSLEKLQEHLRTIDPVQLLSVFSLYGLTSINGRDPEPTRENPVLQHHVELLQALVLRFNRDDFEYRPVLGPSQSKIRELVTDVEHAFSMKRLDTVSSNTDPIALRKAFLLESMRVHTQAVRNWGYPEQIVRIVTDIFSPMEDQIRSKLGVRIDHLLHMCRDIVKLGEERMANYLKRFAAVYSAKSIDTAVNRYFEVLPNLKSDRDNLRALFRERGATLDKVKGMLHSHYDLRASEVFSFTLDELAAAYPGKVDQEALRRVLDKWVYEFGGLSTWNPEHFFLGNPIWTRPIIRVAPDSYFWPLLGLFYSFCLEMMESVIEHDRELWAWYEKRRGAYLEESVEKLFQGEFPTAKVFRGSLWRDPATNQQFENDILVLVDTHAIVVEAKAGKIPEKARRGADLSLQRAISDLLVEPSRQSQRFADYLINNPGEHNLPTKDGTVNSFDTSTVTRTVRLGVTLDFFGHLSSRWPELRDAGLIPSDVLMAPNLALADLELVFDLLTTSSEKLHYLVRRAQFEENAIYMGDEMDLLSFYLDTGFNIGETEYKREVLMLSGMSKSLDAYFMQQSRPKPQRKMTPLWRRLLNHVESRRVQRWTEITHLLLNVDVAGQREFERALPKIKAAAALHWKDPRYDNIAVLHSGPAQRRGAIVAISYRSISTEERNRLIHSEASKVAAEAPCDRVLVFGFNVDSPSDPYSVLACLVKQGDTLL